jgi:hypothetical protein
MMLLYKIGISGVRRWYGPTYGFTATPEVGLGGTVGTLNMGYPLLLCQGESSGATIKDFTGNQSSIGLRPTIRSHDEARITSWTGFPSPSSPIKERINNFNYDSRILHIGPGLSVFWVRPRTRGCPRGAFWSRTVSPTVARWFVLMHERQWTALYRFGPL